MVKLLGGVSMLESSDTPADFIYSPFCNRGVVYISATGAEAYKKDLPNAKAQFLDTGHFAIETHVVEIAAAMKDFVAAIGGPTSLLRSGWQ